MRKAEKRTALYPRVGKFVYSGFFAVILLFSTSCQDQSGVVAPESDDVGITSNQGPGLFSQEAHPHINNTEFDMPVTVAAVITADNCTNNPGPQITFSGVTSLGGFSVRTIFRNNMKGTHEREENTSVDVSLQADGEEIVIPKQPVRGGTGGNPFIWVQFLDENGEPASEEIFVGRCVQGSSFKMAHSMASSALSSTKYSVNGCENSPGPEISFDASLGIAGINARIIFRNNDNPVGGPHEAVVDAAEVEVIPSGLSYTFPKQPVHGGVGGNPWIWTQSLDGSGNALSDEILLGRCVQLSKATS